MLLLYIYTHYGYVACYTLIECYVLCLASCQPRRGLFWEEKIFPAMASSSFPSFLYFFFLFFFVLFFFFFICGLLVCTKCCWVCLCFAQPVSSCQDDFLCSQFEEEPVGLWMDGASSFLSHKRVKVCMCDGINCPSAGDLLNVSSNFFF